MIDWLVAGTLEDAMEDDAGDPGVVAGMLEDAMEDDTDVGKTATGVEDAGAVKVVVVGALETGEDEAGAAGVVLGVDKGVDDTWLTGQTVVPIVTTEVIVVMEFAGQFVTVGAQLVTTISVVLRIVDVVISTPVSDAAVGVEAPSETERLPPED